MADSTSSAVRPAPVPVYRQDDARSARRRRLPERPPPRRRSRSPSAVRSAGRHSRALADAAAPQYVDKIDLGEEWLKLTGVPFVYAIWAGRPDALTGDDVRALQQARDEGAANPNRVAAAYFGDPALQAIGARYLRDNIKY